MSTEQERIAQFENMAAADPTNEMAHFSLGSAYLKAERPVEAAASFEECIRLNPDMSKAFELAGEAMVAAGWEDRAADVLTRGYELAAGRGDLQPQQGMGRLLEQLGRELPDVADLPTPEHAPSEGDFVCRQSGRAGTQLEKAPFRGPLGEWIAEHISAETWNTWIGQGTKVINELRLDLSRPEDAVAYDTHMCDFLDVPEKLRPSLK